MQRSLELEKQVLEVVSLGKGFPAVLGNRDEIKEREGKKMRGAGTIAGKVPVYGGRQVKTAEGKGGVKTLSRRDALEKEEQTPGHSTPRVSPLQSTSAHMWGWAWLFGL